LVRVWWLLLLWFWRIDAGTHSVPRWPGGSVLRRAREAAGLTPEHLADEVGRSAQSLSLYELGKVVPPRSVQVRLARAVGLDVRDLDDAAGDAA